MSRYVSVVITCPYSGKVDPERVKDVSRALLDMGCYEVSLGDTVGTGNPTSIRSMLEVVMSGSKALPAENLAVSSPWSFVRHLLSISSRHIFTTPLAQLLQTL